MILFTCEIKCLFSSNSQYFHTYDVSFFENNLKANILKVLKYFLKDLFLAVLGLCCCTGFFLVVAVESTL